MRKRLVLLTAAALAGCGHKSPEPVSRTTDIASSTSAAPPAPAPHSLSIDAPGLKASLSLPNVSLPGSHSDIDGMKLYPGTEITGMAVAGAGETGGVTMRYAAPADPQKVLAFYRDAAPKAGFKLGVRAGNAVHATKGARTSVAITAMPAPNGGSAGTISVSGA